MIDNIFRRVIAYVMDMILVSIVVSSIISAKVVNFQIDEYNKKYDEYNELYNLYIAQHSNKIENCDDLEKAIEEEKLREEKYVEDLDKLKDSLSKQDITKEEYSDKCSALVKDYNSHKMTDEEYLEKSDYYYYQLEKNSIVAYIVSIVVSLLYFVFFQGFTGGQTLGKKLNRVKVISCDDNKVSYKQLFIRTLFLHSNIYYVLMLVAALFIPKTLFNGVTSVFYMINYILSIVLVFTISFSKGKSGIHDMIAKTKIIEVNFRGNPVEVKEEEKDKKESNIKKSKNKKEKLD